MKAKELATNLLKEVEGCKLRAYQDGGGVWTIGYGETGKHIYKGMGWTQEQAENALSERISHLLSFIYATLPPHLPEGSLASLVSFIYNVGKGAFLGSTMYKLLNSKKYLLAAQQFDRWVYDNGKKVNGLVNRRVKEKELFLREIK
jgi:lysozyme